MLFSAAIANDSDTCQNITLYTSDAWKDITSVLSIIMLTYEASVKQLFDSHKDTRYVDQWQYSWNLGIALTMIVWPSVF